jgi:hypothetical protein
MPKPLVIPCCLKSLCQSDAPILNLSAELSDGPSFIGYSFGGQNIPPVGTSYRDPPGSPCFTISGDQLSSDQSAERCQVRHDTDDAGGGGGDWHDPNGDPPVLYGNTAQACSLNCADGLPFTYTVPAGSYIGLNQIVVDRIAHSYACQLATLNRVCLSSLSGSGCLNQAYMDTIIPLGQAPFTFSIVSGALPPGLTFSSSDTVATVSGTPSVTGLFSFRVRVVDGRGNFMQKTFSISVLDISNKDQAPQMSAGNFYSFQLIGAGGMSPYVFSAEDLPEFLSISDDGLISGIANQSGPLTSVVTITDALGNSCDVALNSAAPCPFFDSLVWNAPFIVDGGPNPPNSSSYVVTPNGRMIELNLVDNMVILGQPLVYDITADCTDTASEEIECTITINVKSQTGGGYGPTPGDHGGWYMQLQVFDDNAPFATFLNVQSGIDFGPGVGVYSFPVTITAGARPGIFIAVNVGYPLIDFGPISGAIDVVVTFGV